MKTRLSSPLTRKLALLSVLSGALALADAEETARPPMGPPGGLTGLKTGDPLADWNSNRVWTAADGRKLQAEILNVDGETAVFRLQNGVEASIPLSRLSKEDNVFIAEWVALSKFFNLGYKHSRNVTNVAEAGLLDGAFAKEGKIHETRHFRFECDEALRAEVVADFSKLFEATYNAVAINPLGLALARPAEAKFPVRLFANKEDYLRAGGSASAAGVYLLKDRVMLVPLESLGLAKSGSGGDAWKKARDYDPATLIHETTHALTDQWLPYVPMWFAEGFPEFIAAIPYHDGTFDFGKMDAGLVARIEKKFGGSVARFQPVEPAELMGLRPGKFMGATDPEEPQFILDPVRPFQIQLVKKSEDTSKTATSTGDPSPPGSGSAKPLSTSFINRITRRIGSPEPDLEVLHRYSSSMLLVDKFLRGGQEEAFRRYLFALLYGEWDRNAYIAQYDATLGDYRARVNRQIDEFNAQLRRLSGEIDAYNAMVSRKNAGEDVTLPPRPGDPVVPDALPVPEILANPRKPTELSNKALLERAELALKVPQSLTLPR